MPDAPDKVMSIDELAEYLKVSRSTLYILAREGRLPGQKVGKRWRFHKDAIDGWLKRHPTRSTAKRKSQATRGD